MGTQKCLCTEKPRINVETEPRTYCCSGGAAIECGDQHGNLVI